MLRRRAAMMCAKNGKITWNIEERRIFIFYFLVVMEGTTDLTETYTTDDKMMTLL